MRKMSMALLNLSTGGWGLNWAEATLRSGILSNIFRLFPITGGKGITAVRVTTFPETGLML